MFLNSPRTYLVGIQQGFLRFLQLFVCGSGSRSGIDECGCTRLPEAGEVHVLAHPRQRLTHHQVGVRAQVLYNLHNVYIYSVADP